MLKIHKKLITSLTIAAIGVSLSGCTSALSDTSVHIKQANSKNPVMISTYNYEGQKIDQIKTNQVKVEADKNIDSALSVKYGQNRIIHENNPMLIFSGLTNFADQYDKNISNKTYVDPDGLPLTRFDKSQPIAGEIYGMFKKRLPADGTAVIIKSKSGDPIGIFAGHVVSIKSFDSNDDSNAVVTIDGHKILIYSAAYTIYPISAMKSMYHDTKATTTSHQAQVHTQSITPKIDNSKSNKK